MYVCTVGSLGYLGVSPNIHTTGSDHTSDVYASPSGMVGKEIAGRWVLFKPPAGVAYETDYAGTVITIQNQGDGTYMLTQGGTTTRRIYANQWRSSLPYWDAQGRNFATVEQCVAPGDPVNAFFTPGAAVPAGLSQAQIMAMQNDPNWTPGAQGGTTPPPTTTPPPLQTSPPVQTAPPRTTGPGTSSLPPTSTPPPGYSIAQDSYQQVPPGSAPFPDTSLPASDGGPGMSGAIKWGLAALAAFTLFK